MAWFRKILTTALLAGLVAGIVVSVIQHIVVQPLIVEAERYEAQAAATQALDAPAAAQRAPEAWEPEDGAERTIYTVLANLLTGIGFALLLGGGFAIYGGRVDAGRGVLWGIAGFVAFALAPALGLPPEAPGVPAADLVARQGWWLGTVIATAAGLAAVVFAPRRAAKAAGVVVMTLPHLIGAPHHAGAATIPPELATAFVIASLATTALFWLVLGGVSGALYRRIA